MVVARTGALLALALAFRLASRLAGGGVTGAIGGAVAALALFVLPDWLQFAAHGSEAPWAVALMLWAIERHLDGRRDHAFVLGVLACLLRPELVPFLGVYTLWLWWAEPRRRAARRGRGRSCPPPPGSCPSGSAPGNPLDGARQATGEPVWSLSPRGAAVAGRARARLTTTRGCSSSCWRSRRSAWQCAARRLAPLAARGGRGRRGGAVRRHDPGRLLGQPALRPPGADPGVRARRGRDGPRPRRRRQAHRAARGRVRRGGGRRRARARGDAVRG